MKTNPNQQLILDAEPPCYNRNVSAYDEAYNARWYDPVLGRFAQADTISFVEALPNAVDAKAFDRYAPMCTTTQCGITTRAGIVLGLVGVRTGKRMWGMLVAPQLFLADMLGMR